MSDLQTESAEAIYDMAQLSARITAMTCGDADVIASVILGRVRTVLTERIEHCQVNHLMTPAAAEILIALFSSKTLGSTDE